MIRESEACIESAWSFLKTAVDPAVIQLVKDKQVASQVLKAQMRGINHALEEGLVTAAEADAMESDCLEELQHLVDYTICPTTVSDSSTADQEAQSLLDGGKAARDASE